jgi:hypothetical protein
MRNGTPVDVFVDFIGVCLARTQVHSAS